MALARLYRVLVSPRVVFQEVATAGKGYGLLFLLLAVELFLRQPAGVARHAMRFSFSLFEGLMGLWSLYIAYALKPAVLLFFVGIGLYYILRATPQRIEIWNAASVVAYAWVPHLLVLGIGVVLAGLGYSHELLPQHSIGDVEGAMVLPKLAIEYGPCVVYFVVAVWACRKRESSHAPIRDRRGTGSFFVAGLAAVVLVGVSGVGVEFNVRHVVVHWEEIRPVVPGDRVPPFSVRSLDGVRTTTHRDLAGQVTLVDFWATWCGPCVKAMPALAQLHRELAPRGLRLLSVNTEPGNLAAVRGFVKEHELPFEVWVDAGEAQRGFTVDTLPTIFIIDRAGRVHSAHLGTTSAVTLRREAGELLKE